jgi:hypothetical protein
MRPGPILRNIVRSLGGNLSNDTGGALMILTLNTEAVVLLSEPQPLNER